MKANPKSSPHPRGSHPKHGKKKKGIALITVLLVLSLMVILVIAILSTSMREMRSANISSQSVRSQDLANTVTSLVVAQLKAATKPSGGQNASADTVFAWTSQPGMIRNYDESGFQRGHRLYSSSDSIVDDVAELIGADALLAGYDRSPERFVDLNAPAIRYGTGSTVDSVSFPILDPRAEYIDEIEGFEINVESAPGSGAADIQAGRLLPMPVEWLYMLEDGSLGTLSSAGRYSGSGTPSEENPMVARFGYWVDDDTCKININVASEAAPWDIPRSAPEAALDRGERQPAFNELYRYSGHPATTCLSSIFFPGFYPDDGSVGLEDEKILEIADLEEIYEITPKVAFGGSEAGRIVAQVPVELDTDRLFPSIDEMVFRVTRVEQEVFSGGTIDLDNLERARGFLTARSRAPEINIHGKPRVATWPIDDDPAVGVFRSGFDATMAFCSTLNSDSGPMEFIVQREFAENPINELYTVNDQGNAKLLKYILDQTYADLPFYGTKLAEKYGGNDAISSYDVPNNNPTPDDFLAEPFGEVNNDCYRDHTAIALMILDYIRTVNMHDAQVSSPYADPFRSQGDGQFNAFGQLAGLTMVDPNIEQEAPDPLEWHEYGGRPILKGMGRHYTISEVALVFFCSAEQQLQTAGTVGRGTDPWAAPATAPRFAAGGVGSGRDVDQLERHPLAFNGDARGRWLRYIQVGMLFELSSPMQGFHQIHPKVAIRMITSAGNDSSGFGGAESTIGPNDAGYKGAWGRFDSGEYNNEDHWRRRNNIAANDLSYTEWEGYTVRDEATGFKNPITYWGNYPANKRSDPMGPLAQSLPEGIDDPDAYKGQLPKGFFGWGGSGGYRLLRFPREGVADHAGSNELTNGQDDIQPFYAQKPIVLTSSTQSRSADPDLEARSTMDLLRPTNGAPIQLILYDEQDENATGPDDIIQVIEVSFETNTGGDITGLPIPNAPFQGRADGIGQWGGWGRRLTRAGNNTPEVTFPGGRTRVDVLNDADTVISMIPRHGDLRHIAGRAFVPKELWRLHPLADRGMVSGSLTARDSDLEADATYGLKAHSLMFSNPYGSTERPLGGVERLGLGGALGATFLSDFADEELSDTDVLGDYVETDRSYAKVDYGDDGYEPDMTFNPEEDEDIQPNEFGFLPRAIRERDGILDIAYDPALTRDFDNGTGAARDGAYANKADDGADPLRLEEARFGRVPYFNVDKAEEFDYRSRFDKGAVDATFSPNQMIPSPVMFGSLPNMLQANIPWSTLLFRPDLQDRNGERVHFGRRGVAMEDNFDIIDESGDELTEGSIYAPDHLWLDLFWMPIVDPFPISEPLSTLGKINMNYQMIPFSYIKRATGMHAVLKSERILAIPDSDSTTYKQPGRSGGDHYYKIDAEETLKQFDARFAGGQAFVTESEICENFLYPAGPDAPEYDGLEIRTDVNGQDDTQENIRVWWDQRKLTGDNSLERPYANIYGRLTTKSNTFTVHMTVQVLKKARSSAPDQWVEGSDRVTSTYRGSSVIERFIDPNRTLPQYLGFNSNPNELPRLDNYYEYRVVNTKEFSP